MNIKKTKPYNINMTYKEKTKILVEEISTQLKQKNYFHELEKYVLMIEEKNQVMNITGFKGDTL
jgi:16S rRNA G527 N7-methylase RsmG